jgi:uncharacterized protein YwqG
MDSPDAEVTFRETDMTIVSTLGSAMFPWSRFVFVWETQCFLRSRLPRTERLPANREALLASLRETDLPEEVVRRLTEQGRRALTLETKAVAEEAILRGASKIGGRPDLPPHVSWPCRPPYPDAQRRAAAHRRDAARMLSEATGPRAWLTPEQGQQFSADYLRRARAVETTMPLTFIAQTDLTRLAAEAGFDTVLPDRGRLLFFYDMLEMPEEANPHSRVGFRLIWDDSVVESLTRRPPPELPEGMPADARATLPGVAALTPHSVVTPIPPNEKAWDAFSLDEDEPYDTYIEWLDQFGTPDGAAGPNHQLGGWPRPLQNGMQARSQLAFHGVHAIGPDDWETPAALELLKDSQAWRLVLQIGRDDAVGLLPAGAVYVLMRDEDLRARAFDRIWTVYQCN